MTEFGGGTPLPGVVRWIFINGCISGLPSMDFMINSGEVGDDFGEIDVLLCGDKYGCLRWRFVDAMMSL